MRTANIAVSPSATPSLRLPLPVMVAAFCLLWASAFSVAKLAIADYTAHDKNVKVDLPIIGSSPCWLPYPASAPLICRCRRPEIRLRRS